MSFFGSNRRFVPAVLLAGAAGTAALSMSVTGTLSAFTAAITDSANTTSMGTLVLQEKNSAGTVTCLSTDGASNTNNAATCSTINTYGGGTLANGGGTLANGGSSSVTVNMTNLGTGTPTAFTLSAGTCTQSGSAPTSVTTATDLCSQLTVKVYANTTGTPVFNGTLTAFNAAGAQSLTALAPSATQAYTVVVAAPSSLSNGYMGLTASQPLTWTLSS